MNKNKRGKKRVRSPVKKFMDVFCKPSVAEDRTKYNRKRQKRVSYEG